MAGRIPYTKLIEKNLFDDPDWGPFARSEASLPDRPRTADGAATNLFYLGEIEKARNASLLHSQHSKEKYLNNPDHPAALYHGFRAALFADLAAEHSEAQGLWKKVTYGIDQLPRETITNYKAFNLLINQAYGLTKLERFDQVIEPAREGRKGIEQGKGTFDAPHRNSREFALAPLLIRLAEFKMNDKKVSREEVQEALQDYKTENVRYGRLGYPVIFDLQFSYPDVFDPVLPGEDPEKD